MPTCKWNGCRQTVSDGNCYCKQHKKLGERLSRPAILRQARESIQSTTSLEDEILIMRFLQHAKLNGIEPTDFNAMAALAPEFNLHVEQLARVIQTHHKIRKDNGEMLPRDTALSLIDSISEMLKEEFRDDPVRLKTIEQKLLIIMNATFATDSNNEESANSTPQGQS